MLQHVRLGKGRAYCDGLPETMESWMAAHPGKAPAAPPAEASGATRAQKADDIPDHVLVQFPWAKRFCTPHAKERVQTLLVPHVAEEEPGEVEEPPLNESVEHFLQVLSEQENINSGSAGQAGDDFFTRFRLPHRQAGHGYDEVHTEPKKGGPREWCRIYGMTQTVSFSVHKYGDVGSMTLALEAVDLYNVMLMCHSCCW